MYFALSAKTHSITIHATSNFDIHVFHVKHSTKTVFIYLLEHKKTVH
jgi:hypothetical protein